MTITHKPKTGAVLTGTEYEAEDAHIFTDSALLGVATVTLTNAQIKALPSTPIVLVPATETLNYTGVPTQLFLPISTILRLNNSAGAYTNVDVTSYLTLHLSSTGDLNYARAHERDGTDMTMSGKFTVGLPAWIFHFNTFLSGGGVFLGSSIDDSIFDNAVSLSFNNNGAGDLTGGNAANTLEVTVYYVVVDL